ncbi:hypothetical protein PInf_010541 [Phytophthora infestans]|nr:hypothetical protein PInf_028733 [Phytophthora infestans]KAI9981121.1 hypothetical protein PInf_010541 [Phytophthora infestans]
MFKRRTLGHVMYGDAKLEFTWEFQHHNLCRGELFRNFQDLAKFVRTKGTKEELPPELKAVFQERHLN